MAELQIKRVEDIMFWLEKCAEDYTSSQSINWLIDHAGNLCHNLAFVNNQMAIAKKMLNEKKVKAYESLIASEVANEKYFAPSLAKDYIAGKCSVEQYNYDICERCSRSIVHILDTLRTCISTLRTEIKYSN